MGRGFANRLIAEELRLSVHTVIAHVREIRNVLGVRSGTRIATWITEGRSPPRREIFRLPARGALRGRAILCPAIPKNGQL
jgi:hypothetical protein